MKIRSPINWNNSKLSTSLILNNITYLELSSKLEIMDMN